MKGIVRSMTGFGRDESESLGRRYTVEIKTVNHRFLDVNIKMPKVISKFEAMFRHDAFAKVAAVSSYAGRLLNATVLISQSSVIW